MRSPFKTVDELSSHLATTSEAIRIDYNRRLEQSSVAALSAHFERELANKIESQVSAIRARAKKVNLVAALILLVLAAIVLSTEFTYVRFEAWFIAGAWLAYLGATELFFIPTLQIQHASHWNGYQKHARQWSTLLGNSGFSEHISLVGKEYQGDVCEDADKIELAVRGYALLKAEQAAKGQGNT